MSETISFVVVSAPRSGTTFTADLFDRLGIPCGHEQYFTAAGPTPRGAGPLSPFPTVGASGPWGDSSWMAAPFLRTLPPRAVILHQVREPIATLNSLIHTGHMDMWNDNEYIRFVRDHWGVDRAIAQLSARTAETKQAWAMAFWAYWHRLIERESEGHKYIRYQVERIDDVCGPEVPKLFEAIAPGGLPGNWRQIAAGIPNYSASKDPVPPVVNRENVSMEVRRLAERYGYTI